jgi:hypothetical protein
MGLASIWAFVEPKYQNTPDNVAPAAAYLQAPPAITLRLNPTLTAAI